MKRGEPDNSDVLEALQAYNDNPSEKTLERVKRLGLARKRSVLRGYPGTITLNLATQVGHCMGERLHVFGVPFEAVRTKTDPPYSLSEEPNLAVFYALEAIAVITF